MFDFPTDTTSSEDEKKEPNYYKSKKLIKPFKVFVKKELTPKELLLRIKFRKEKSTLRADDIILSNFAEEFVTKTIIDKYNALITEMKSGVGPLPYQTQGDVWMTVGEFTQIKARKHLEEFVSSWELSDQWLYCIRFLDIKKEKYDDVYTYQVIWSTPTQEQPIPKATASVYFSFVVSMLKPRYYPVNVFFSFECSRLVHLPGKTDVKEHILKSIIESKLTISNMITF